MSAADRSTDPSFLLVICEPERKLLDVSVSSCFTSVVCCRLHGEYRLLQPRIAENVTGVGVKFEARLCCCCQSLCWRVKCLISDESLLIPQGDMLETFKCSGGSLMVVSVGSRAEG